VVGLDTRTNKYERIEMSIQLLTIAVEMISGCMLDRDNKTVYGRKN